MLQRDTWWRLRPRVNAADHKGASVAEETFHTGLLDARDVRVPFYDRLEVTPTVVVGGRHVLAARLASGKGPLLETSPDNGSLRGSQTAEPRPLVLDGTLVGPKGPADVLVVRLDDGHKDVRPPARPLRLRLRVVNTHVAVRPQTAYRQLRRQDDILSVVGVALRRPATTSLLRHGPAEAKQVDNIQVDASPPTLA